MTSNNPTHLHVHHIDGDKSNDKLTNLMVLCSDCHTKLHPHMLNSTVKDIHSNNELNYYRCKFNDDCSSILYFDTETTGLSRVLDDILQLSIVNGCGDVLYNGYFHPIKKTTWVAAERINHISPAMVENAPLFSDELDKIQRIFDGAKVICGYNIGFDLGFLINNGLILDDRVKQIDVLSLAKKYVRSRSHKLVVVAKYLGYDFEKYAAHNSLGDALATKYVYEEINRFD